MASSQQPYSENRAQPDLLLLRHMQSPDRDNRDDQNHKIAHNIDNTSADEYGVLIKAFLSLCNFVGFADAFGRNGEDEGERVEKIPVEDEPNARFKSESAFHSPFSLKVAFRDQYRVVWNERFLVWQTCIACDIRVDLAQKRG